MKKHQSHQNPPLMYIIQPDLEPIFSSMQKSYIAKRKPQGKKEKKATQAKPSTSSFHTLSIDQKINTLLHLPKGLEHVSCNIVTKEKETIKGRLDRLEEGYIYINDQKIKVEEIEDIQLIGL
ncbi:spore coat CotO family protein [Bacillus kexueae]|uniref:spore coat CotO family protein n=1 Tax=Aeribacillus kexueae TaxID=2078952 RepID=UPI001FAF5CF4|nr:spore coat CotO family protein [Bacillus kexueae]